MLSALERNGEIRNPKLAFSSIKESALDRSHISGHTHNLYKYPACYSPSFPRAVIRALSKPGDHVLDCFIGGGTSAVEASLASRNIYSFDLNPLAVFITKLKTLTLSQKDVSEVDLFFASLDLATLQKSDWRSVPEKVKNGIPDKVMGFLSNRKATIDLIENNRAQTLIRGVFLKEAKLLLDNPSRVFNSRDFLNAMSLKYESFVESILFYDVEREIEKRINGIQDLKIDINNFSVDSIEGQAKLFSAEQKFSLIVTSPPYPGKHILYNKWQPDGRKETHLPIWIVGSDKFVSENHFLMGGRSENGQKQYFETIKKVYTSLVPHLKSNAVIVQMVAFGNKEEHLPKFLESMDESGFKEHRLDSSLDRRVWRDVPNQKWYNRTSGFRCEEVVLFHTLK